MRLEYELQLLYASAYLASSAIQLELNVDKQVALSTWVNIIKIIENIIFLNILFYFINFSYFYGIIKIYTAIRV